MYCPSVLDLSQILIQKYKSLDFDLCFILALGLWKCQKGIKLCTRGFWTEVF